MLVMTVFILTPLEAYLPGDLDGKTDRQTVNRQYTLNAGRCTLNTANPSLCTTNCTLYTAHCALHTEYLQGVVELVRKISRLWHLLVALLLSSHLLYLYYKKL